MTAGPRQRRRSSAPTRRATAGRACEARFAAISAMIRDAVYAYTVAADGSAAPAWSAGNERLRVLLEPTAADHGHWVAGIHPDDVPRATRQYARLLSGEEVSDEFRLAAVHGDIEYVRVAAKPERAGRSGKVVGFAGVLENVTPRRLASRALAATEARLRDFALAASDWFWETDADHVPLRGAKGDLTGAVLGAVFSAQGHWRTPVPDAGTDGNSAWALLRARLDERTPFRDFSLAVPDSQGRLRHLRISGKPVFDENGAFRGYRGTAADVTASVEAERRAETAEARLRSAIESLDQVFVLYDKDDRVVLCNRKWREVNRLGPDDSVEGMKFEEVCRQAAAKGLFPAAIGREEAWIAERARHHRLAAGSYDTMMEDDRWMRVTDRRTPDGGFVVIRSDIQELVEARERAQRAEARLLDAIDSMDDIFLLFDKNDRVALHNRKWRQYYRPGTSDTGDSIIGMRYEEVVRDNLGRGIFAHSAGREDEWLRERMQVHGKPGIPLEVEFADGRWLRITERRTDEGGIVSIRTDITALKERERALKESEQRFKDFAETASDHFWEQDEKLRYAFVSAAEGTLSDGVRATRIGHTRWEIAGIDPDADERWRSHRDDLLARRPFRDFHYSTIEADGSRQHWSTSGKPLFDDRGVFRGYRGIAKNMTAELEERQRRERAEAYLRDAIESLDDPFVLYDDQDRVVLHNRKWREYFRADMDEPVIGMRCEDVLRGSLARGVIADARGREEAWLRERMERHRNPGTPFEVALSDGRWLRVAETRTRDGGIVSIRTDVTALKESEQRFKDFAESASDDFWQQDENFRFTFISAHEGRAADTVPSAVLGHTRWELADADPDSDAHWRAHRDDLRARRPFRDFQFSLRDRQGRTQFWRVSGNPLFDPAGTFKGYRGVAKNVTAEVDERWRREQAEARLLDAIESLNEGFALWGADDRLVLGNSRHREIFAAIADRLVPGVAFREVVEAAAQARLYRMDPDRLADYVDWRHHAHLNPSGPFTIEMSDGRYVQLSERRTRDGSVVGIWTDITDLVRREREIAEKSALLETTFENIDQGIVLFDAELKVRAFNHRYLELLDLPAERARLGTPYADLVRLAAERGYYGRGDPEAFIRALPDAPCLREPWRGERVLPNGGAIDIIRRPVPGGGLVVTLTDITDRKRLEAQLLHSQKMESLGTLAGGIAHDVNNTLMPIIGLTELALEDLPEDSPVRPSLERVIGAGHRIKALVSQVLAFSRRTEPERRLVDIAAVVRQAITLLRATTPAVIEIRADIADDAGTVQADANQIHQVLLNLSANAAQAMLPRGGVLAFSVSRVELASAEAAAFVSDLPPGPYVRIAVCDTGPGIDPAIVGRIFDPFFTTKPVGEGTGMGLAMVHGIVAAHRGAVRAVSEKGRGATFEVFLPVAG